ncbi:MAG: trypsin-like peptidase domain-containing protein [Pseudomonadota bacterium]
MRKILGLFFFLIVLTAGFLVFTQRDQIQALRTTSVTPHTAAVKTEKTTINPEMQTPTQENAVSKPNGETCLCQARVVPQIVEQLVSSVVSIAVTESADKTKMDKAAAFDPNPEALKDYFDGDNKSKKIESGGSGFVIKGPDGHLYILTNAHVIGKAQEITVITHDKQKFLAEVKAGDTRSDLAILKLKKGQPKLPDSCMPVEWGDASTYPVGAPVIAIGNPFEFGSTVSDGIISFKNRDIPRPISSGLPAGQKVREFLSDMMQHTAPINVGSSGGPLIGMEEKEGAWVGRVIGVNSTMLTTTGGNIGISFAIPSTIALPIIDQLFKSGKVDYAWLGTIMQELLDTQKSVLGLSTEHDAYKIVEVEEGSPANKAGFEKGDIITHLNDQPSGNLTKDIQKLQPGGSVTLKVLKGGIKKDEKSIDVVLGIRPDTDFNKKKIKKDLSAKKWPEGAFKVPTLDLVLEPKTVGMNGKNITGFKIIDVDPEHPKFALEARETLEPGDVLLSLNGEPLTNRKALETQIETLLKPTENANHAILSFNVKNRDDDSLKDSVYRYEFGEVAD